MKFPDKLQNKLNSRAENKALRTLGLQSNLIDFSSNDYLGFAKSQTIFDATPLLPSYMILFINLGIIVELNFGSGIIFFFG